MIVDIHGKENFRLAYDIINKYVRTWDPNLIERGPI